MNKRIIELILRISLKVVRHKLIQKYQQFLKYCIGGGTAFIIYIGLLYVLTDFVGLWYMLSATIAFVTSAVYNYLFQRYITFKSASKRIMRQFLMFGFVAIIGLLINNLVLHLLVERIGFWYILASIFAAATALIWNFIANKKLTFKHI